MSSFEFTGLPKCPRCGSIISGPHACVHVSSSPAQAVPAWCHTCRSYDDGCLHKQLRAGYARMGELIAKLDRAYQDAELRDHFEASVCDRSPDGSPNDRESDEVTAAKAIILRGWDDHMWSFEHMVEEDELWLLRWAGHPSGGSASSLTPGAGDATQGAKDGAPGTPTDSPPPQFCVECGRDVHGYRSYTRRIGLCRYCDGTAE